jgi:hypothetical protein
MLKVADNLFIAANISNPLSDSWIKLIEEEPKGRYLERLIRRRDLDKGYFTIHTV